MHRALHLNRHLGIIKSYHWKLFIYLAYLWWWLLTLSIITSSISLGYMHILSTHHILDLLLWLLLQFLFFELVPSYLRIQAFRWSVPNQPSWDSSSHNPIVCHWLLRMAHHLSIWLWRWHLWCCGFYSANHLILYFQALFNERWHQNTLYYVWNAQLIWRLLQYHCASLLWCLVMVPCQCFPWRHTLIISFTFFILNLIIWYCESWVVWVNIVIDISYLPELLCLIEWYNLGLLKLIIFPPCHVPSTCKFRIFLLQNGIEFMLRSIICVLVNSFRFTFGDRYHSFLGVDGKSLFYRLL